MIGRLIAPAGQWRGEQRNGRTITAVRRDNATGRSHSARRMQSHVQCPETHRADTSPPHVAATCECIFAYAPMTVSRATMIHGYHRTTIKAARAARGKLIRRVLMLQQLGRNFVINAPRKSLERLSKETLVSNDTRAFV